MSYVSLMRSEALSPSDRDVIWPMGAATTGHCQCLSVGGCERVLQMAYMMYARISSQQWMIYFLSRKANLPTSSSLRL